MNAAGSRIDLGETSCTFSTTRPVRNAGGWASTCNSWRKSPMTNCLAGEPWLSACQTGAAELPSAKGRFGWNSTAELIENQGEYWRSGQSARSLRRKQPRLPHDRQHVPNAPLFRNLPRLEI